MSGSIHSDSEKEEARGSFGYSDVELYRFMFGYLKPFKSEVVVILVLMVFFALATAIAPLLLFISIDRFSQNKTGDIFGINFLDSISNSFISQMTSQFPDTDIVWFEVTIVGFIYILLLVLIFLFQRAQIMRIATLGYKAELSIRLELFQHLQELDLSYHDRNEIGRIMSRLTSDLSAIREMLGGAIVNNLANLITVITVGVIILLIDPVLSLVPFVLIPIVIYIGVLSRRYTRPRRKETRRTNSILMANIGESIAGIKVTKGHNREAKNIDIFESLNEANREATVNADSLNAIFFPILLTMSTLGIAFIVLIGGSRVIDGSITIGVLIAFLNYNAILFRPVVLLGQFYQQLQDALTGAERIYALMDTETQVPWNDDLPDLPPIKGEVVFDRISFSYLPNKYVYRDFSLYVPAGKTIALVGKTGAGKSTIINILSRLYEFQEGELRIDGHEVHDVSLRSYRKQIAAVPQDYFLFSTSIRENLKLGNPMASEEVMLNALDQVGLKDFVLNLENGLDTPLQERGGRLSIGQRQLLMFATVLLADPRILILDEATSSIDVFSEIQIQKAVKLLLSDRTAFIIAHRLSTIRNADSIVVIDDGDIVEQGTHDELIKQKGYYYDLIKNQIELAEISS
ncbi:MAG: putative ABC transporter ATP-binding protein [Candidatus Heimdallarchaeota archaeon LC_2]|nr:MAG: putative ABC transporter ATP-binding protein [Candidatus Heimdallarchaeota archaeon LC_2]